MISIGKKLWVVRTDKVTPASDVNLLQFRNDIGILESTINDGYHHAFTLKACLVQLVALEIVYLVGCGTIDFVSYAVVGFKSFMIIDAGVRSDRIG